MSDSGALNCRFVRVDLAETVRRIADGMQAGFASAGLQLTVHDAPLPLRVSADAQRLGQLVANLLHNAMRYTDAPGRVDVSLRLDAGRAELRVDDTAPGVAAEHLPHLFERLYRADSARARPGSSQAGAGLGLSICRSIADSHGGTLVARPSPLGGLQVVFTLPAGDPR